MISYKTFKALENISIDILQYRRGADIVDRDISPVVADVGNMFNIELYPKMKRYFTGDGEYVLLAISKDKIDDVIHVMHLSQLGTYVVIIPDRDALNNIVSNDVNMLYRILQMTYENFSDTIAYSDRIIDKYLIDYLSMIPIPEREEEPPVFEITGIELNYDRLIGINANDYNACKFLIP